MLTLRARGLAALSVAALSTLGPIVDARADELSRAHDAMQPHNASRSGAKRSSSSDQSDDDDSDSPFGKVIAYVLAFPWTVPYWLCEGGGMRGDTTREFAYERYPYADGASGALRAGPLVDTQFDKPWLGGPELPPDNTHPVAVQFTADQAYVLGGLSRSSLAGRLQTPLRFELDTAWSLFAEPLESRVDTALAGNAHVTYRFAQTERVQFRTGLGYGQWTDRRGTEFGIDFLYGVDVFWGPPVTTSMSVQLGNLGEAFVIQFRGTVGVMIGSAEVIVGYDHFALESTTSGITTSVGLGGPLLGLRVWL